jgi:archaellum biogenesis ATPase FlaH
VKANYINSNELQILHEIKRLKLKVSCENISTINVLNHGFNSLSYSSGITEVDILLNSNGFPSGSVIEVLGQGSSGKTHICICAAIASALRQESALLIDTSNGITMKRVISVASVLVNRYCIAELASDVSALSQQALGANLKAKFADVMSHITIAKAFDMFSLLKLVSQAQEEMKYKIVVVDGLEPLAFQLLDYSFCEQHHLQQRSGRLALDADMSKLESLLCNVILLLKAIASDPTTRATVLVTSLTNLNREQVLAAVDTSSSAAHSNLRQRNSHTRRSSSRQSTSKLRMLPNACMNDLFDISLFVSRDNSCSTWFLDQPAPAASPAVMVDVLQRPFLFSSCPLHAKFELNST